MHSYHPAVKFVSASAAVLLFAAASSESLADARKLDPTATFRYAYYQSVTTFNPHREPSANSNIPLFLAYDRLVHISAAGTAVPGLATAWSFSPDGLTLSLTLRKGVKFHDGSAFDAEAVKQNLTSTLGDPKSAVAKTIRGVTSVKVVDANRVDLILSEKNVSLPLALSDRAGAMVCPSKLAAADLATSPCGAGMYKISQPYRPGVGVTFERFADYWEPNAVGAQKFEVIIVTDGAARLNALRTGAANAAWLEPDQIDQAERANLKVLKGPGLTYLNLFINTKAVPELADPRVRQAMSLAIDRKAIVAGLLFGQGAPTKQPFPPGYFAASDDVDASKYDPAAAKRLLAEAGYPSGFTLTMQTITNPLRTAVMQAIAAQWQKVGIMAKPVTKDAVAVIADITSTKNVAVMVSNWSGRNDPSQTFESIYLPNALYNPAGYDDQKLVALYDKSLALSDVAERAKVLRQMSAQVANEVGSGIAVYAPFNAIGATANVEGLQLWLNGKVEFRGVGIAK